MPRIHLALPFLFLFGPLRAQSLLYERYGPGAGEQLGYSIAGGVDFDHDGWDDLVVGNPYEDSGGLIDNGSVRIVSGQGGSILYSGFGNADQDHFGWSVALAGDMDGDGFTDVIAGAPEAQNGAIRPGMVQVFSYETLTVLHTLYGGADLDQFGYSVDGGGLDVDADGFDDFLIGAPGENVGGAARVYSGSTGAVLTGYIEVLEADARTGASVASLGDVDGSGNEDWGFGSPGYGGGDGRVMLFEGVVPPALYVWMRYGGVAGAEFGAALEGKLDLDGDGLGEYVVGAPGDPSGGTEAGSAVLLEGLDLAATGTWFGEQAFERFGASIAKLPDLTGDGRHELVVGAPGADAGAGLARIFSPFGGAELFRVHGEPGSGLGHAVCRAGDFNDDGFPDVAASGPLADDPQGALGEDLGYLRVYSAEGPGIVPYCTPGTSASGCQAALTATGTPSATALGGFFLGAVSVEGSRKGIFFYGANGRQALSWGNGTSFQCVVPPVKRGGLLVENGTSGNCDGWFLQDLNARWCPSCPKPNHNFGAGAVVQAQLWYRDPGNTSNQTTSLSNAVEFVVGL